MRIETGVESGRDEGGQDDFVFSWKMTKTTQLQSFQFWCDSKPIQALRLSTAKAHPSFGTGLFDLEY